MCELCDSDPATEKVDIDPLANPGRFTVECCQECAEFERTRINTLIKNNTL
jgi:hypothetical protein